MPANEAVISICMIVKNEEKNLSLTLPSLAAGADELIIVDTGSNDDSAQLAKNLGAQVHYFEWTGDFSEARNFSISKATGDWIFWVDADEYVRPEDLKSLKEILKNSDETAYQVYIKECSYGTVEGGIYYWRVRLFRNFSGIHFERPINEQLFDQEGQLLSGPKLEIALHHWGNRPAIGEQKFMEKKQRNLAALKKAIEAQPRDPVFRFLMGFNLKELGEFYQAAGYFDEVFQLTDDKILKYESLISTAWCFFALHLFDEALVNAERATALLSNRPEAYVIKASVLNIQKKYQAVIDLFSSLGSFCVAEEENLNVDLTFYYYLPNFILGEAFLMMGRLRESLECFKKAYRFSPEGHLESKIQVIENALAAGVEYYPADTAMRVTVEAKAGL